MMSSSSPRTGRLREIHHPYVLRWLRIRLNYNLQLEGLLPRLVSLRRPHVAQNEEVESTSQNEVATPYGRLVKWTNNPVSPWRRKEHQDLCLVRHIRANSKSQLLLEESPRRVTIRDAFLAASRRREGDYHFTA